MPPYAPVLKLASLTGANGFRIDGVASNDLSGLKVSDAGDVNGDGYGDVIIGADGASPGGNAGAGSSYVVFGKAAGFGGSFNLSTLAGANGFRIDGAAPGDGTGKVSSAGDVNGDGYDDLIIGAPNADPGGNGAAGSSYVVFGQAAPFAPSIALAALDGASGFRLDGGTAGDLSGIGVSSAGDINGDGYDDIIVGALNADPNGIDGAGAAYVVFGKAAPFDPALALSGLTGADGFRIDGVAIGDGAGRVSAAGDVNGDGYDDIVVGAYAADPGGINSAGSSYVVFGKAGPFDATLSLASLDGTNGFRLDGVAASDGAADVSNAGDINGDGYDDLIIGAVNADPGGNIIAGSTYVVFGKADGFSPTIALASLDGANGFRLDGVAALDGSGASVSAAGDVNGDGFDDLIVGAYQADPGALADAGSSYVVFGKAGGFAPARSLGSLNGADGYRIDGVAASDKSGYSVSAAGDVNGDGLDDLIVGAYNAAPGGNATAGSSFVVFGTLPGTSVTRIGSEIAQTIRGGAGDDTLDGLDGDDKLISNAGDDTLRGGAGNDALDGGLDNDALSGGSGNDTLTGGAGADTMAGGSGDDTYVDPTAEDTVTEASASGSDTIQTAAGFDLAAAPNVENVTLTGTANVNAIGGAANNRLTGNAGNNTLTGGNGNDTLAGLGGIDTLNGGAGNDIYVNPVNGVDIIVETAGSAGGEHDRIQTLSSFNISTVSNVEDITLVGAANVNAIGNNLANILIGNPGTNTINGGGGADTITGGSGNDTMNGGSGADLFKFATTNTGGDRINGFETSLDHFDLAGGSFSGAAPSGADTVLTHAGGTIRIVGITGLDLAAWNALVVNGARVAPAQQQLAAFHNDAAIHMPASFGHFGSPDFIYA